MPQGTYNVTGPDGTVHTVQAASEQAAIQMAQQGARQAPEAPGFRPDLQSRRAEQPPEPPAPPPDPRVGSLGSQIQGSAAAHDKPKQLHPLARFAAEIATGVAASSAAGPFAPLAAASRIPGIAAAGRGVMKLPRITQIFGRNAAEGAGVAAAFAPEGEARQAATRDALIGGVGASVLGVGGQALRGVGNIVQDFRVPSRRASAQLNQALEGADLTPAQQPGGMLADVNTGVTRHVQQGAPNDATQLLDVAARRQDEAFSAAGGPSRLSEQAGRMFPDAPTPSTMTRLGQIRKVRADNLFIDAYAGKLSPITRELANNLRDRPIFTRAEASARERLANEGILLENITNVRGADKTLAALRAARARAVQQEDNDMVRLVDGLYEPLRESLESTSPAFRKAMNFTRETNLRDDAFTAGRQLFDQANPDGSFKAPSITTRQLAKMTPAARRYFWAGVMDNMMAGASRMDQRANIVSAFSNRGTRDQLKVVLPAEVFGEFKKFVDTETKFWKTFAATQQATGKALPTRPERRHTDRRRRSQGGGVVLAVRVQQPSAEPDQEVPRNGRR